METDKSKGEIHIKIGYIHNRTVDFRMCISRISVMMIENSYIIKKLLIKETNNSIMDTHYVNNDP